MVGKDLKVKDEWTTSIWRRDIGRDISKTEHQLNVYIPHIQLTKLRWLNFTIVIVLSLCQGKQFSGIHILKEKYISHVQKLSDRFKIPWDFHILLFYIFSIDLHLSFVQLSPSVLFSKQSFPNMQGVSLHAGHTHLVAFPRQN